MGNRNLKEQLIAEMVRRVAEEMTFTVQVVEEDEGGYSAFVEELPGCITEGDTREELDYNLGEAITGYLECLADEAIEANSERKTLLIAGNLPPEEMVPLVRQSIAAIPSLPYDLEGFAHHVEQYHLPVEVR